MASVKAKNTKVNKKENKSTNNVAPFEIDYEKLAEAIVKAEVKAKEELKNKTINTSVKKQRSIKESIRNFWKLMTIKREEIEDDSITFAFLKLGVELIVLVAELALFLFGLVWLFTPLIVNYIGTKATIFEIAVLMFYGLLMLIYSRLLRVSRLEIDRLNDREYLNAIVGSFMGIVGTIIALLEFVRSVRR